MNNMNQQGQNQGQNVAGVQDQVQVNQQQNMGNNQMVQSPFLSNPYINQNQNMNNTQQVNPYINQGVNTSVQTSMNAQNIMPQNNANDSFFNGDFVKGALIGAGVTFLLTNKTTQKAIFNGFSKGSELVQAGIEELKERMEDAKAQMEAKNY